MAQLPPDLDPQTRAEAWIGDAVLALYVRELILNEFGHIDGQLFIECTSNQFLRLEGNATAVEAQIGRLYSSQGLAAANDWMTEHLLPRIQLKLKQFSSTKPQGPLTSGSTRANAARERACKKARRS